MIERGTDSGRQRPDWRATLKRRVVVAAGLLGLWAVGIEARLIALQVFERADLVKRAESEQQRTLKALARRGDILDRNGRLLATSVDAESIFAEPTGVSDPPGTVKKLCAALGDCTGKERQGLLDRLSGKKWSWVRRQVSPEVASRVKALNLDGIGFTPESTRKYPNGELAAHVLGWVGVDNNGLSGIESAYDGHIRGKDGKILIAADAKRHAFDRMERPPAPGSSIELTIDEYLQHVAERELHAGVVENHAASGSAIIMNPHTGEILAMANEPTFNPNDYRSADDTERRNRAVQDAYEPGSTFKLVTASAAVENKVIPLDAMVETSPGYIKVGANIIHDTENHGTLSFSDVIADSSNVGAAKIGLKVGADRLVEYIQRFGFGRSASPDFLGENDGIVWAAEKLGESALAHVSIGYQVAVTPLQMIAAVSSIANGGTYIEPRVVRAEYRDGRRYVVTPKTLRQSISPDTAATLTSIMEGVVDHGTATAAQINGFTIAGKTGTAAKLINHRYSSSEYNASFVGFLPSRNPVVSIIVVIDSPHGKGYYGGVVSAPIFKRIAEATLRYLGVGPTINPAEPVIIARKSDTTPVPTSTAAAPDSVVSLVADGPIGTMPDLSGLSARDAMRKLVRLGVTPRLTGEGVVVSQRPQAGATLDDVEVCDLDLERSSRRPPAGAHQ